MSVFREDAEGPTPTRAALIHLVNIWLDLEGTIREEVGPDPSDSIGVFELGRAAGVGTAAQDLLELLRLYAEDEGNIPLDESEPV